MEAKKTRGERNNNPLNIRIGNYWIGEVDKPTDSEFEQFKDMRYGIRAAFIIIRRYIRRYGLRTIIQIVSRWAPATENNTKAYIAFVSRESGIAANAPLRWTEDDRIMRLVAAMAKIESGIDLTQEQLLQGYEDATYC